MQRLGHQGKPSKVIMAGLAIAALAFFIIRLTASRPDVTIISYSEEIKDEKPAKALTVIQTEGSKPFIYYYDTQTKRLIYKEVFPNSDITQSSGCSVNQSVKFLNNGSMFYRTGDFGGEGGEDLGTSGIYKSPNDQIYLAREAESFLDKWAVNEQGTVVYVARSTDQNNYELVGIDTTTKKISKIADVENIANSRLYLSGDGDRIAFYSAKSHKNNDQTFVDGYVQIVNVLTGSIEEKLIEKDQGQAWEDYSGCSMGMSPDFSTVFTDTSPHNKVNPSVKALDLKTMKESLLYRIAALGQIGNIQWNPENNDIIFTVNHYKDTPSDQGIVLLEKSTGQAKQLVKSNIITKEGEAAVGGTSIVDGSFTRKGFLYTSSSRDDDKTTHLTLYYYDLIKNQTHDLGEVKDSFTVIAGHLYE